MEIFDSTQDLRVVIRTPTSAVLDIHVTSIEVQDHLGRFEVKVGGDPVLTALVPSDLVLHKRDGGEVHVTVGWGSLTAVGAQARIVVNGARVRYVDPQRAA